MEVTIACFSDTHTKHNFIDLPDADIAIFAGDFSHRGGESDTRNFMAWYSKQYQCTHRIMIGGNHDLCLDYKFDSETGADKWARPLFMEQKDIIYLYNNYVEILGLKIWGSPVTPDFFPEHWAFNQTRGFTIEETWNKIPRDTDIIVTHGPPQFTGDYCNGGHVGCEDLARAVETIMPQMHVFGHIHEGYGVTQKRETIYVNASVCDKHYNAVNEPVLITLDV